MIETIERRIGEISEWLGPGTLNFFGRPFAGKDTNSEKLAIQLDAPLTSDGHVFNGGHILRSVDIPDDVRQIMERGELIPSDRYKEIVIPYLGQTAFQGKPLILSSVGRVIGEEIAVLEATEKAGHPTLAVPYLDITDDEVVRRLTSAPDRGRVDDSPDVIYTRLEEYRVKTMPLLESYDAMGLLVRVDAMPDEETVFKSLVNTLHEFAVAT